MQTSSRAQRSAVVEREQFLLWEEAEQLSHHAGGREAHCESRVLQEKLGHKIWNLDCAARERPALLAQVPKVLLWSLMVRLIV